MDFCCEAFKNLVENMGRRGTSVILFSEMGSTYFCLQSRGYDAGDAKKLENEAARGVGKINIVSQTGIQYCPFCGNKLEKWLTCHKKDAEELIKRSDSFMMRFSSNVQG